MSVAPIIETAASRMAQKALVALSHFAATAGPDVQYPNLSVGVLGLLHDAYPGLFPHPNELQARAAAHEALMDAIFMAEYVPPQADDASAESAAA